MSNSLSVLDLNQLPSTQIGGDEAYNDLAKSAEFLGRLQLFTKGKAIDRGLVRPGHYGIPESGEDITVLSDSIDVLVLARRPKAIDMNDKDAIIVVYNHEAPEFKRIAAKSLEKESNCMYGPSFLVIERTTGRFLEFFCGTKSTRTEAQKIYPFLPLTEADIARKSEAGTDTSKMEPHGPLAATFKSRLVEKGNYSWHVPVVMPCSTPFTKLPSSEKMIAEIVKFVNPPAEEVERVEEPAKKGKRAR